MTIWEWLALAVAITLCVPFIVISVELFAAQLPTRRARQDAPGRPRVAVLMPAHNEEIHIRDSLETVKPQLSVGDRLVVIADNCTDDTARQAMNGGAEVIERNNESNRGKGFALDAGIQFLCSDPPDIVIVVDADTRVLPGAIDILAAAVARSNRPQQCVYLHEASSNDAAPRRLATFAFMIRNEIRPRGLDRLSFPCLLYGAGMAFPWKVLAQANLAHGDITEDIRLGVELARQGHAAAFCPNAHVRGDWPDHGAAVRTQRVRWEHGHLRTMVREVPRLIYAGIAQQRIELLTLALDLGVPPMSLMFLVGIAGVSFFLLVGQIFAGWLLLSAMIAAILALIFAWLRFARHLLGLRDLATIPHYLLGKVPIYLQFLTQPQREWVRTGRDSQSRNEMVEKRAGNNT